MQDFKYLTKREQNISQEEKKKKYIKIFVGFFIIILAIAGLNYLYIYLKNKKFSFFKVKYILINGIENAPKKKIDALLKKYKNKSLTDIDLKKLYLKLKNIKWIDDVIIRKKYPSKLVINIIEKKPVSVLEVNDKFYLIDINGDIIDRYSHKYFSKKFVIFHALSLKNYNIKMKKYIPEILLSLKDKRLLFDISEISFKKGYITMFLTEPKIKVVISPENFKTEIYKINVLKKIKNLKQLQNAEIANLDFKNRIYLSMRINKRSK